MKRQNDGTTGQYKRFGELKMLLAPFTHTMDVLVDQRDSYYLSFPNEEIFGAMAGGMFAAVQIKNETVDLYIYSLMNHREIISEELRKEVEGIIDVKGVIHLYRLDKYLKETIAEILHISAFNVIENNVVSTENHREQ